MDWRFLSFCALKAFSDLFLVCDCGLTCWFAIIDPPHLRSIGLLCLLFLPSRTSIQWGALWKGTLSFISFWMVAWDEIYLAGDADVFSLFACTVGKFINCGNQRFRELRRARLLCVYAVIEYLRMYFLDWGLDTRLLKFVLTNNAFQKTLQSRFHIAIKIYLIYVMFLTLRHCTLSLIKFMVVIVETMSQNTKCF